MLVCEGAPLDVRAAVECRLVVINTTSVESGGPCASATATAAANIYICLALAVTCLPEGTTTHLLCHRHTDHNSWIMTHFSPDHEGVRLRDAAEVLPSVGPSAFAFYFQT